MSCGRAEEVEGGEVAAGAGLSPVRCGGNGTGRCSSPTCCQSRDFSVLRSPYVRVDPLLLRHCALVVISTGNPMEGGLKCHSSEARSFRGAFASEVQRTRLRSHVSPSVEQHKRAANCYRATLRVFSLPFV